MPPFLLAASAVTTHHRLGTTVVSNEKVLQFKRRNCNKSGVLGARFEKWLRVEFSLQEAAKPVNGERTGSGHIER
jgi:hypothetical protein